MRSDNFGLFYSDTFQFHSHRIILHQEPPSDDHAHLKPTPTPLPPHAGRASHVPQRSLLTSSSIQAGPADAFNRATHPHHSTKEKSLPGQAPDQLPSSTHAAPNRNEAGAAKRPSNHTPQPEESGVSQTISTIKTLPEVLESASVADRRNKPVPITPTDALRSLLSLQNGPADVFNKATRKHRARRNSTSTHTPKATLAATTACCQQALPGLNPFTPVSPAGTATPMAVGNTPKAMKVDPSAATADVLSPLATAALPAASTNQRSLLGADALQSGPADAFNKATRAHHTTKEASRAGKTTSVAPKATPTNPPTASQRSLLGANAAQSGPADAFNKATRAHHTTKEASRGGKTTGVAPGAQTAPTHAFTAGQRSLLASAAMHAGPADAFNRASHAHHATKESAAASTSKTHGAVKPTEPGAAAPRPHGSLLEAGSAANTADKQKRQPLQAAAVQKPPQGHNSAASAPDGGDAQVAAGAGGMPKAANEPGRRSLLQWGWSGSSASASAQAQAGSGGFGGDSWSGAQGKLETPSERLGNPYTLLCTPE
jgi:hypothetical protein